VRDATPQDRGAAVSRRCCASRRAGPQSSALRSRFSVLHVICAADAGSGSRSVDLEALRRKRAERPQPDRTPPARTTSAPPRRQFYSPKATQAQLQLNKDIQACASADAVLELVASQWAILNEVNAATALTMIQRRAGKQSAWLQSDPRFVQLLSAAESLFERMGPQALSNMIYACGQLAITPPPDWLERFWNVNAVKLGEFLPQNLSNTFYACGQLGIRPPTDWMQRFWQVSAATLGDWNAQDLSNTIYSCGQLGITPPADWLERFWLACGATLGAWIAQDFSNTIYACGQLGITPPGDWLPRYWHASALKLGEFKPQELSNTFYACGLLGITPPVDWLERFWQASANKLGEFTPQALSNSLLACGQLGVTPPGDWLERFSSAFEQALPDLNQQQELANTAVALTMLQLWELPLWLGLWERLCSSLSRNIAGWSAEDQLNAMQMFQAYQAAAVKRPGLLPAPSPELLAAARKSWIDRVRDGGDFLQTGRFHDDVSACLTRMGLAHANEHWCDRAERSIDIVIEGALPVALEVDGPSHFLQDGRQGGRTQLRNRMLAAHGWRVVVVDYRVWNAQQTQEQREAYLRGLLAD
jgi:hypothetical protein